VGNGRKVVSQLYLSIFFLQTARWKRSSTIVGEKQSGRDREQRRKYQRETAPVEALKKRKEFQRRAAAGLEKEEK